MSGLDGLPAIPETALPADVRRGSAADKASYRAAAGFERLLVSQLVSSMTASGPLAEGPYAQTMQDALSGSLEGAGGLGLARQLFEQTRGTRA
jgi:Rod binding domain-containing protein